MSGLDCGVDLPIHAFYEIISGFAGQPRDWARLRSLFIPESRLVPGSIVNGSNPIHAVDIDTYIEKLTGFLSQHDFFETGAVQKVEVYGRIASVISTYEARCTPGNPLPLKRGANYVHLVNDGSVWRIAGMVWCDERL